jgi:hypothetical protein
VSCSADKVSKVNLKNELEIFIVWELLVRFVKDGYVVRSCAVVVHVLEGP